MVEVYLIKKGLICLFVFLNERMKNLGVDWVFELKVSFYSVLGLGLIGYVFFFDFFEWVGDVV